MTSFVTIFGILPITIGIDAGGESHRPLGMAVVAGLLFSTLLTLVVVPIVYALLARYRRSSNIDDRQGEESPSGRRSVREFASKIAGLDE